MEKEIMEFGERLQRERKQAGLTQKELADKLHVTHQAVAKWEQGSSEPSMQALIELSEIFGVDLDYLIKGEDRQGKEVSSQAPQIVPVPTRPRRSNKFIVNFVFFIISSVWIFGMFAFAVLKQLLDDPREATPWFHWFVEDITFISFFIAFLIIFIFSLAKLLKENKNKE